MQPQTTDNNRLPRHYRNLLPLTGTRDQQFHLVYALTQQRLPRATGRPWRLPLTLRVPLVLAHLQTNLTTRALAAPFDTGQSAGDRIIHQKVPTFADMTQPDPNVAGQPMSIVDGTLIPVHDQSITAVRTSYRRSINTQIIICTEARRVITHHHAPARPNRPHHPRPDMAGDRHVRARIEHVIARLKDWQILRQMSPRGTAINHSI